MSFLESLFGVEIPTIVSLPLAFAVVFGLIAVFWFLARRFIPGARQNQGSGRSRQPRLGVIDAHAVDTRRKLVLVRRDNVEHLIMIGGPNDLLIESAIHRGRPAARPAAGPPGPPAAADSPPSRLPPVGAPVAAAAAAAMPDRPVPDRPVPDRPTPVVLDRSTEPAPDAAADLEQALKESFHGASARAGLAADAPRAEPAARRDPPARREPPAPEVSVTRRASTPDAPVRPVMPEATPLRPIAIEGQTRPSFGDGSPLRPIFVGTPRNGQSSRATDRSAEPARAVEPEPARPAERTEAPRPVIDTADLEAALFAPGEDTIPTGEQALASTERAAPAPEPAATSEPAPPAPQPQPVVRREFPAFDRPARPNDAPRGASLARRVLQGKAPAAAAAPEPAKPQPVESPVVDPSPAPVAAAIPAPVAEKPAALPVIEPAPAAAVPAREAEPVVSAEPPVVPVVPPAPPKPREPIAVTPPAPAPAPEPVAPAPVVATPVAPPAAPPLPSAEELARSLEARLPSLKLPEIRRPIGAPDSAAPTPVMATPEPPKDLAPAKDLAPPKDLAPAKDLAPPKPAPKPAPATPPDPFASLEQEMASLLGRTPGAKEP